MINKSTYPQISKEATKAIERLRKHIDLLPEERRPKVCISSITYNHEPFIAQTLEGFVMQQTDFPFVAVVHDDASTDGTADIIRKYAEKYPEIIFPIFERENQYHKAGGPLTLIMHLAQEATCAPYIAKCEGDDYWTSPQKLQLQADFLDTHQEYVICSHRCNWINVKANKSVFHSEPQDTDYYQDTLLCNNGWPLQTTSIMYRSESVNIDHFLKYKIRSDAALFWHVLRSGYGYYFREDMATYRFHPEGVWSSKPPTENWDFDFKTRKSIFEVENDLKSALYFLKSLVNNYIGRRWLIVERKNELIFILKKVGQKWGYIRTCRYILHYILFLKESKTLENYVKKIH